MSETRLEPGDVVMCLTARGGRNAERFLEEGAVYVVARPMAGVSYRRIEGVRVETRRGQIVGATNTQHWRRDRFVWVGEV